MKLILSLLLTVLAPIASQEVISLHGSGTTNPRKCYWDIMDKLTKQSKQPIRLTYRGVGSSTGQEEFIGNETAAVPSPYNDFGSGDIPLSQEDFEKFADGEILHLPVLMGAIGFFHSVPMGDKKLNLTPCLLAMILNRDITNWMHPNITAINEGMDLPDPTPIYVARRVQGSSSTKSITSYLNQVCEDEWPDKLVGKTIDWAVDTLGCEGSGGMTKCIRDQPGTIGYIDSGHGHAENLQEIELQNADGEYISSEESAKRNGILAATNGAGLPDELDGPFYNVNLLNRGGPNTWPIVALSYIYVRKDLSYLSPESASLLKAFLRAVYDDDYSQICADEFGFVPVRNELRTKALAAIDAMDTRGAKEWTFEKETTSGAGQDDYVFSVKRDSYSEIEQDSLVKTAKTLEDDIEAMSKTLATLEAKVAAAEAQLAVVGSGSSTSGPVTNNNIPPHEHSSAQEDFYEDHEQELTAALALGAVSMTLWIIALLVIIVKFVLHI